MVEGRKLAVATPLERGAVELIDGEGATLGHGGKELQRAVDVSESTLGVYTHRPPAMAADLQILFRLWIGTVASITQCASARRSSWRSGTTFRRRSRIDAIALGPGRAGRSNPAARQSGCGCMPRRLLRAALRPARQNPPLPAPTAAGARSAPRPSPAAAPAAAAAGRQGYGPGGFSVGSEPACRPQPAQTAVAHAG